MSKKSKKGRFVTALILSSLLVAFQAMAQPQPAQVGFVSRGELPFGAVEIVSDEKNTVLLTKDALWLQTASGWTKIVDETSLQKLDPSRWRLSGPPRTAPWSVVNPEGLTNANRASVVLSGETLQFSTLCPRPIAQYNEYDNCAWWSITSEGRATKLFTIGDNLTVRGSKGPLSVTVSIVDKVTLPWFQFTSVDKRGFVVYQGIGKAIGNGITEMWFEGVPQKWGVTQNNDLVVTTSSEVLVFDKSTGKKTVFSATKLGSDEFAGFRFHQSENLGFINYWPTARPIQPERLWALDLYTGKTTQVVAPGQTALININVVKSSGSVTLVTGTSVFGMAEDLLYAVVGNDPPRLVARNGQDFAGRKVEMLSLYLHKVQGCNIQFATRKAADLSLDSWYTVAIPCITQTKVESGRVTLRGQNLTTVGSAWVVFDGGTRLRPEDCRRDADDVISCALSAGEHTLWAEVDGVPSNKVQVTVVPTAPPTPTITTLKSADPFTGCALPGAFAPGSLLTLSGNSLAGGEVLVNGQVVPAHAASETEIQFLLPTDLQIGTAKLRVNVAKNGLASASHELELSVVPAAPCLAEGNGLYPLVYDDAGNELRSPAQPGQTVLLLSTGLSAGLPAGITMGEIQGLVEMSGLEGQPGVTLLRVTLPEFETTGGNPVERELLLTLGDVQVPIRLTTY